VAASLLEPSADCEAANSAVLEAWAAAASDDGEAVWSSAGSEALAVSLPAGAAAGRMPVR
jgi:hypothetical protein